MPMRLKSLCSSTAVRLKPPQGSDRYKAVLAFNMTFDREDWNSDADW